MGRAVLDDERGVGVRRRPGYDGEHDLLFGLVVFFSSLYTLRGSNQAKKRKETKTGIHTKKYV